MKLTPRQQHALQSICDTFAPSADGWPSASDLGIPAAIAAALDFNPRSSDRAQLLQLLDLWDSRLHTLFTLGRLARFSSSCCREQMAREARSGTSMAIPVRSSCRNLLHRVRLLSPSRRATPPCSAMFASSARAPVEALPPQCSQQRGRMSLSSKPAAILTTPTSTAPSLAVFSAFMQKAASPLLPIKAWGYWQG